MLLLADVLRFDAEQGAAGVDVTTRSGALGGSVLWEISSAAAHDGKYGYSVTLKPFARFDDARLSLPPFQAMHEAYQLSFWAFAHGHHSDVRVKLLFEDASTDSLLDAWSIRLSSVAWRRQSPCLGYDVLVEQP